MPLFTPITNASALPPPNASYENASLDAKVSARKGGIAPPAAFHLPELAKDVAAFANAIGGTILIGATEKKDLGLLGEYRPLAAAEAADTANAYNNAIATLCSPRPLVDIHKVPREDGVVVSVNVWPFIGQLVGVSDHGKGSEARSFQFPYRVGHQTVWIEPEQLAMFMIPSIRRTVILLEGIPPNERAEIQIFTRGSSETCSLQEVNVYENIARFKNTQQPGERHVPLDDFVSIWKASHGKWRIRLHAESHG